MQLDMRFAVPTKFACFTNYVSVLHTMQCLTVWLLSKSKSLITFVYLIMLAKLISNSSGH